MHRYAPDSYLRLARIPSMTSIHGLLESKPYLLMDGAWGTALRERTKSPEAVPERYLWENPGVIADLAQEYAFNGAELITTNTFGVARFFLGAADAPCSPWEMYARAVMLLHSVLGRRCYVLGSIGPLSRWAGSLGLPPPPHDVRERFYVGSAEAFAAAGANAVLLETITDIDEACTAVRAIKRRLGGEVWASVHPYRSGDSYVTADGSALSDGFQEMADAGADVLGLNCGEGPEALVRAWEKIHGGLALPLFLRPSAGIPSTDISGTLLYPVSAEDFATWGARFIRAGCRIFGGCCGTSPAYIRALRIRLNESA